MTTTTSLDSFNCRRKFTVGKKTYEYFSLKAAEKNGLKNVSKLPFSTRLHSEAIASQSCASRPGCIVEPPLLEAGDHEEAIHRYEHALSLEPGNWAAHNDTVTAYEEAGLIREAAIGWPERSTS